MLPVPLDSYVTFSTLLNNSGPWLLGLKWKGGAAYLLPGKAAVWLGQITRTPGGQCQKRVNPKLLKVKSEIWIFLETFL